MITATRRLSKLRRRARRTHAASIDMTVIKALSTLAESQKRRYPGSPGFPTTAQWNALNQSVSGHLVAVEPSAKFCHSLPSGNCTDAQWTSSRFRDEIPGAVNQVSVPHLPSVRDSFILTFHQIGQLGTGEHAITR